MQVPYSRAPIRLGPYELLRKLATGGMAEIYEARRVGPHGFSMRIAVKRILPQLAADSEFVAMFIDEARLCAQLAHPNLVQVFDFGEDQGELYMAMELVEGTNGAKVARAAATRQKPVPTEVALHIGLSIARGLAHAHDACREDGRPLGLVHRDVSPGNILISHSGAVKLTDFGIARAAEFERRTEQGQLKGKLGYMSPEQVTGRELDAKSDQFTAAIVLTELLVARPLFSGVRELDVLVKIRDVDLSVLEREGGHIPAQLMNVLKRALSRRRQDRFPTTADYVEALEQVDRKDRLGVGPAPLVEWLRAVQLVKDSPRSGEHEVARAARKPLRTSASDTGKSTPAPYAKSSGTQPVARATRGRAPFTNAEPSVPPPAAAPTYRIDPPSGSDLSLLELVDMLSIGRLSADTLVSRDGASFKPALEFAELRPACGSVVATRGGAAPTKVLRLSPGELPGRLFDLVLARATGVVIVRCDRAEKKVYLVEGIPEVTDSNDERELLGSILVERGIVSAGDVAKAVTAAPRHGGRLGDALVRLSILTPMELVRIVVHQTKKRFLDLLGWKRGELTFTPGVRCTDEETVPEAFSPLELIAQGIVRGYSEDDLVQALTPLEHAAMARVPRPRVSLALLKLEAPLADVVESVTGQTTVGQAVAQATVRGASRHHALLGVFMGLSSGILVSPAWPPAVFRETLPTVHE